MGYIGQSVIGVEHPATSALTATSVTSTGAVSGTTGTFTDDFNVDSGKLFVDVSTGKVGIGDTSPDALLSIKGDSDAATTPTIRLKDGTDAREAWITNESGDLSLNSGGSDDAYHCKILIADGNLVAFHTSGAEKARFDSSGNFLVGTTSAILGSTNVAGVQVGVSFVSIGKTGTSTNTHITFSNGNGQIGAITTAGSSTSYGTSSDYRLKTAVTYDWDATTRLKQLKPARFKWIADGDDAVSVDGFLAHEAQAVVPEAVTGTKDEVDADGNPVMQGIDQSKIVPLLCKTILELEARITALESA